MRILLAPDKYKDALPAAGVARAMAHGVRQARPAAQVVLCPLADGGEGTGPLLARAAGAAQRLAPALDPLARRRRARWWWQPAARSAILELAEAAGLALLEPARRDATRTTSFGAGQLLCAALAAGARRITLCVGGSATVDGGAGCLQALGWELLDRAGRVIREPAAGRTLARIGAIRRRRSPPKASLELLCDVDNPLLGPRGAARMYAPQKGASPVQSGQLEAGLRNWARVLAGCTGRQVATLPGAGAAGGLPAALTAALGAELKPGFREVARRLDLGRKLAASDLCLTGEGRADEQTVSGKVVAGVAQAAARAAVPVVAFVGQLRLPAGQTPARLAGRLKLRALVVVTPAGTPLPAALAATAENLRAAVAGYLRRAWARDPACAARGGAALPAWGRRPGRRRPREC